MRPVFAALIAIALSAVAPATGAANPYAPALIVNDRVITVYDVDQRVAFLDALGRRAISTSWRWSSWSRTG